jgi:hypothetical protein
MFSANGPGASILPRVALAGLKSDAEIRRAGAYLAGLARQAHLLRQTELVEAISRSILDLPLPSQIQCIGSYYPLLSSPERIGSMKSAFVKIADDAAPGLRERVMLQIARSHFRSGDLKTALLYFIETAKASVRVDPLTYIQAHRHLAIYKSIEGDHRGALSHLEQLQPAVQAFRHVYPTEYLDQLNSLAVELGQLGRINEARRLLAIPLGSSLAPHFPTWHDTRQELDEIEAKGVKAPPIIFAIGSVVEPKSLIEGECRAEVSAKAKPETVHETVRAQEAEPLAQPKPARSRAIATSYKREAIPLAAIPLVKRSIRCAWLPGGTSEKCSAARYRPRAGRAFWRYIRSKPARAPPTSFLLPRK